MYIIVYLLENMAMYELILSLNWFDEPICVWCCLNTISERAEQNSSLKIQVNESSRLFKWLLTFVYNFHPLAKIEFPSQFVSFLLVDRGTQQPLAKVGTLKRKQQMRNFLEQMPKDNHDNIFVSTPFQNKNTKVNITSVVHIRIFLPGIHQTGLTKHGRNDHNKLESCFPGLGWWEIRSFLILCWSSEIHL